jgi:hypothetical protein
MKILISQCCLRLKSFGLELVHLVGTHHYVHAHWQGYPYHAYIKTRGVTHCGLAIYIKSYLKAKEEYSHSNISPCKNIIFKKSSKTNQNPS